ncbi:uncharacterized protein LOC112571916 isoform X1 [Pomacea canaliculata]|uniref:uncharacterized protein LOC112571916 isoform X1 n=1 Tax=Pomacea canaliculata TaxID=400727 RepID=UPI000D73C22E|nr:uncharacterized protein LOC112571916 isoform X1 [Pomacea canaliculata]
MCTCCLGSLSRRGCARVSSRLKHLPTQPPLLLVLHIAKWITRMTFWSRYDPVRMSAGNTDYWNKMRVQREDQSARLKYGVNSPMFPAGIATFGPTSKLHRSAGGIPRLPDLAFPNMGVESSRGQLPGAVARSHPSPRLRRYLMDNEFNRRAREGFRYWLIEKPKPTKFGRYGIGSYKTALGVGNAPRT